MSFSFGHQFLLQLNLFQGLSDNVFCYQEDKKTCQVQGVEALSPQNSEARSIQTSDNTEHLTLRPEGTPDIYIFSFSGHKPRPGDNIEYLCYDGDFATFLDGGVQHMSEELGDSLNGLHKNADWKIEKSCYADALYDVGDRRDSQGFMSALEEWNTVYENYVKGYQNPTRIVVIGHSHGTVWARNLLMMSWLSDDVAYMDVDYLIDLDGVALGWEEPFGAVGDHHHDEVREEFISGEYHYNDSLPMGNWWDGWSPWNVFEQYEIASREGIEPLSIKDIVPPNAINNIEVIAEIPVGVNDQQINYRYDGSRENIETKVYFVHNHIDIRQWGKSPLYDIHDTLFEFGESLNEDYPKTQA